MILQIRKWMSIYFVALLVTPAVAFWVTLAVMGFDLDRWSMGVARLIDRTQSLGGFDDNMFAVTLAVSASALTLIYGAYKLLNGSFQKGEASHAS